MKKGTIFLFLGTVLLLGIIMVSQNENNFMKPSDSKPAYIDAEYYSDHLYCMDLDGKNEKRLWKGGCTDERSSLYSG